MPRLVNIKNKQTSLNYNRYIVGSGVGKVTITCNSSGHLFFILPS